MNAKPKVIKLINSNIIKYELKFPSGKKIILSTNAPAYTTDNAEEIAFASKQKGLFIGDIKEKDYIRYLERRLEEVPIVQNNNFTELMAQKVKWSTEEEEALKVTLKKLGYDVVTTDMAGRKYEERMSKLSNKKEAPEPEPKKTVKKATPKKTTKKKGVKK